MALAGDGAELQALKPGAFNPLPQLSTSRTLEALAAGGVALPTQTFSRLSPAVMCKFFLRNSCSKGRACSFSHEVEALPEVPLDQKQRAICQYFLKNQCMRGKSCRFAHGEEELAQVLLSKPTKRPKGDGGAENAEGAGAATSETDALGSAVESILSSASGFQSFDAFDPARAGETRLEATAEAAEEARAKTKQPEADADWQSFLAEIGGGDGEASAKKDPVILLPKASAATPATGSSARADAGRERSPRRLLPMRGCNSSGAQGEAFAKAGGAFPGWGGKIWGDDEGSGEWSGDSCGSGSSWAAGMGKGKGGGGGWASWGDDGGFAGCGASWAAQGGASWAAGDGGGFAGKGSASWAAGDDGGFAGKGSASWAGDGGGFAGKGSASWAGDGGGFASKGSGGKGGAGGSWASDYGKGGAGDGGWSKGAGSGDWGSWGAWGGGASADFGGGAAPSGDAKGCKGAGRAVAGSGGCGAAWW
eukprot:TRINITY_DN3351_c0_g1_i1.p1 TRINITY_DN3351_c0_g1~~TRINITY_DN3351_c0_g1_i1.p1  ORF type:complete len:502 (-),score=153.90 TRINITY_DN3351_c0_g1_i1:7-1440(-)